MRETKRGIKNELKRMKASFSELKNPKKIKPNLTKCMKCKKDAGNNFIFIYKKNNELKGKICVSCFKSNPSDRSKS